MKESVTADTEQNKTGAWAAPDGTLPRPFPDGPFGEAPGLLAGSVVGTELRPE